jgi:uncharacterized membrane protein YhiD involved in acid resistance
VLGAGAASLGRSSTTIATIATFALDTYQRIQRLAVALAIGLIIGVDRRRKQRAEPEGERAAGMRTLALSGFLAAFGVRRRWSLASATMVKARGSVVGQFER